MISHDDNAYFVLTPERPQRLRREVTQFQEWLIGAARTTRRARPNNTSLPASTRSQRLLASKRLLACSMPSPILIWPSGIGTAIGPPRLWSRRMLVQPYFASSGRDKSTMRPATYGRGLEW